MLKKKKVTIKEIAATANVSKSTVSRVLNNSSQVKAKKVKAVLAAMKKLDFTPNELARGLARGRSLTIGVVTHDIGSPFYDAVAQGVAAGLRESSYSPIFVDARWNSAVEEKLIDTLIERRVDGVILIGGSISPVKLSKIKNELPLIIAGREIPGWDEDQYFIDNFSGSYAATKYLITQGHSAIAFISGISTHQDAIRRKDGFLQSLSDSGIAVNENLIVEGDFRSSSGVLAAEALLSRGVRFSALFASNDEMALGARLLLYRRGIRVPEDVSLIGFDDQANSAFMTPPLTTVRQPAIELGAVAAAALLHKLDGVPFERPSLATKLIIRESVARR
jgi:LacI family transcriptional regulator